MTVVHVPSPLHGYTGGQSILEGNGTTISEVLGGLDADYPGLRFRIIDEQDRIRPTILFYVGDQVVRELSRPLAPGEEIRIVAALSGG